MNNQQDLLIKEMFTETEFNDSNHDRFMETMLDLNLTYDSLERLLNSEFVNRDADGFLKAGTGNFSIDSSLFVDSFRTIKGLKYNFVKKKLSLLTEKKENDNKKQQNYSSPSPNLVNNFDVALLVGYSDEIREKCQFSLESVAINDDADADDVDPMKHFPFQALRYSPACLKDTLFLQTMFNVDYLLKQFGFGVEISAAGPFNTRLCSKGNGLYSGMHDSLIRDLRPIMTAAAGNAADDTDASDQPICERIWIEVEKIEYNELKLKNKIVFLVGEPTMSVKIRSLKLNADGYFADAHSDSAQDSVRFAKKFTERYDELASRQFPEMNRLKELAKFYALASFLSILRKEVDISQQTKYAREALENYTRQFRQQQQRNNDVELVPAISRAFRIESMGNKYSWLFGGVDLVPNKVTLDSSLAYSAYKMKSRGLSMEFFQTFWSKYSNHMNCRMLNFMKPPQSAKLGILLNNYKNLLINMTKQTANNMEAQLLKQWPSIEAHFNQRMASIKRSPVIYANKARFEQTKFDKYVTYKHIEMYEREYDLEWPVEIMKRENDDEDGGENVEPITEMRNYELHHVIPFGLGGPNLPFNFLPLTRIEHALVHSETSPLRTLTDFYSEMTKHGHYLTKPS